MYTIRFTLRMCLLGFFLTAGIRAGEVTVATYNLNFANRNAAQKLDAISTANADVLCLQETTLASEKFLKEQLVKSYPYFYAAGHLNRYAAERFAFASKTPLHELKFVPPKTGLFGAYGAKMKRGDQVIQLWNVHLAPFHVQNGGGAAGLLAELSTLEAVHQLEIAEIVERIDPEQPTLVVGDFNSISSFIASQSLLKLGMTDAFASVTENADSHPTWQWPTRPVSIMLRIDYIFHTSHFKTVKSEVVYREGSDHALVYAVLKWGDPPE